MTKTLKQTLSFMLALCMIILIVPFSNTSSSADDSNLILNLNLAFKDFLNTNTKSPVADELNITSNREETGIISSHLECLTSDNKWVIVESGSFFHNDNYYRVALEIDVDRSGLRDYLKSYTSVLVPKDNDPIQFYVVNPDDPEDKVQLMLESLTLSDDEEVTTIYFDLGSPKTEVCVNLLIELPFNIGWSMNKDDISVKIDPNNYNSEYTIYNYTVTYTNDEHTGGPITGSRHVMSDKNDYNLTTTLYFEKYVDKVDSLNICSASLYNTVTKTVMRKTDLSTKTMVPKITSEYNSTNGWVHTIRFNIGSPITPGVIINSGLPESVGFNERNQAVTLSVDAYCNTGADVIYKWYQQSDGTVTKGLSEIFNDVDDTASEVTLDYTKLKKGQTLPMEIYVSVRSPGLDTVFTENCKLEYVPLPELDARFLDNRSGDLYWNEYEGAASYRVLVYDSQTLMIYTDMTYEAGQDTYHHIVYPNLQNPVDGNYFMEVIVYAMDKDGNRLTQDFKAVPPYTYPGKIVSGEIIDQSPETIYFYPGDESVELYVTVVGEGEYTYSWCVSDENGEYWYEDESNVFVYHGSDGRNIYASDEGTQFECDIFTGQTTIHSDWITLKATSKGDVNLDGNVNVADLVKLQKYVSGFEAELKSWRAADTCNDKNLNVYDLIVLRQILANSAK